MTYSRGGVAGAESNIFSLDGNTDGAAGIAETLLQLQQEEIHLLPLPSAWPSGRIGGYALMGLLRFRLRGRTESSFLRVLDRRSQGDAVYVKEERR